ncbi:MAG: ATP-dependent helicase RhlE [Acidobacteriota bacterium]|jgi:ATP-dependent RNA helicase RhlE|nr:ATP-dependent helicase RhlE [Acidobacteriota bacterium]
MTFTSFDLHPALQRGIADLGFTEPTPIQKGGIPPALLGRDVLACAMTGSGKTAAFVLPILQRLIGKKRGVTRALVLAPTRELAAQIVEHFNDLGRHTEIRAAAVFGGVGMEPQERAFRRGIDVIVACPGRLLDHFQYPYAKLADLEVLVLDEVDRMLDMGFLPDIRRVLKHLPRAEQTLFFSATLPAPIRGLAHQMLKNPVGIDVERPSAPPTAVEQAIYPVRQDLKSALLLEMLRTEKIESAIVFTRTKHRANRLAAFLERHGVVCDRVHGNRSQTQRTQALAGFKEGRYRVLVATDIAARGIDVEGLSHVINFDVPNVPEDYVHRVGRTARAGATGQAITFVSQEEQGDLRAIERTVGKSLPKKQLAGFDYSQGGSAERLEIPIAERIAEIRARKSEERARAKAKAERKVQNQPGTAARPGTPARPAAASSRPAAPTARPAAAGNRAPGARNAQGQTQESRRPKPARASAGPWWNR